ncbi:ABC1 kinase family protein [Congregibacter litoralis]|uniref:Putative unusual protein kinase n=1 Tax=Congregibacter litoralis KT71 TaxID=314285 RepID=A4A627_9GAMM|nr:AarF/ABC1/UbiB kinase family protein [Congregibacter litoralis]EAQ98474.1 putative unusual protein kinase [Congregibacter litoralis KT71]
MAGSDDKSRSKGKAVPASRAGRFAKVARLAGGVAGGMLAEGARQIRAGNRPSKRDLLLTPGNARRVTRQLSEMRGAAMKLGQILSMDSGELLPKELTDILASLRSDGTSMPDSQLEEAMTEAYGPDWETEFRVFDRYPIAAASIGQVHRAVGHDGTELALKIQYPGVGKSINSDVDNIATVLRISGLLPEEADLQPFLDDAKRQLRDEANYLKEAEFLRRFNEVLGDDERFILPELVPQLTRKTVLAMTYVAGGPIDAIARRPQEERDRVVSALVELLLTELFELRMVQTDPNFANYQYRWSTGEIVLLDFGATRDFKVRFVNNYRKLAAAAVEGDRDAMAVAAEKVGYSMGDEDSRYRELVLELLLLALEPLREDRPYDFGGSTMPERLGELGKKATDYADFWHAPPTDVVYFHRKLGGIFMLAARMDARVNVHALMQRWL